MSLYCIGNFDGVHPGHAWLIRQAQSRGQDVRVLTFDPHPRRFFVTDTRPFYLTNARQRERYLHDLGVRDVVSLRFDENLANLSALEFAQTIIHQKLGATAIVAGQNFHFGKDRKGNMDLLTHLGRDLGFEVYSLDLQDQDGQVLSSSRIRKLIEGGAYATAQALWGRNFVLEGSVQQGDQLGRTLGFPTANLDFGAYLRPAFGVYASRATLPDGRIRDSVTNLGRRPTVGGAQDRFETHLFDFSEDLYGQIMSVELVGFIRAEQRFDGLNALKSQIAVDCKAARFMLGQL